MQYDRKSQVVWYRVRNNALVWAFLGVLCVVFALTYSDPFKVFKSNDADILLLECNQISPQSECNGMKLVTKNSVSGAFFCHNKAFVHQKLLPIMERASRASEYKVGPYQLEMEL